MVSLVFSYAHPQSDRKHLDKCTVIIGGIKGEDVEQAVELAVTMHENGEETFMSEDYTDTNVSVKVVKIIQSYVKIVNITVWGK